MMKRLYILMAASAICLFAGNAQTLQKEVTVDTDINPEYHDVDRQSYLPAISLSPLQVKTPAYSLRGVMAPVTSTVATLAPPRFDDQLFYSPLRGYAALGFMPMYNLAASAGYKFLDTDRTYLSAWMQYDGNVYEAYPDGPYLRRHTATAAARLHQAIGSRARLDINADYTYSRLNLPAFGESMANESVNRASVDAKVAGRSGEFNYAAKVGYSYFAFGQSIDGYRPARDHNILAEGSLGMKLTDRSSVGGEARLSVISNNVGRSLTDRDSWAHALLRLDPYYRLTVDKFKFDLGARLDFTFNSGKAFHISPQVKATWLPIAPIAIYVKTGGGEWQNSLSSVFEANDRCLPLTTYGNSHLPITLEAGFNWKAYGLEAELSAQYAVANDWLMPMLRADEATSTFQLIDMKGYKLHASLGYTYRSYASLKATYETAPQDFDHGYYLWRDRARHLVKVEATVNPISDLSIGLGWTYRCKRAFISRKFDADNTPIDYRQSLGCVSNLSAQARYAINRHWSVFATGDNLLNRHYTLINGLPSQGIIGLVGATFKF